MLHIFALKNTIMIYETKYSLPFWMQKKDGCVRRSIPGLLTYIKYHVNLLDYPAPPSMKVFEFIVHVFSSYDLAAQCLLSQHFYTGTRLVWRRKLPWAGSVDWIQTINLIKTLGLRFDHKTEKMKTHTTEKDV